MFSRGAKPQRICRDSNPSTCNGSKMPSSEKAILARVTLRDYRQCYCDLRHSVSVASQAPLISPLNPSGIDSCHGQFASSLGCGGHAQHESVRKGSALNAAVSCRSSKADGWKPRSVKTARNASDCPGGRWSTGVLFSPKSAGELGTQVLYVPRSRAIGA